MLVAATMPAQSAARERTRRDRDKRMDLPPRRWAIAGRRDRRGHAAAEQIVAEINSIRWPGDTPVWRPAAVRPRRAACHSLASGGGYCAGDRERPDGRSAPAR